MTDEDIKSRMDSIYQDENEKLDLWYASFSKTDVQLDGTFTPKALRAIANLMENQDS